MRKAGFISGAFLALSAFPFFGGDLVAQGVGGNLDLPDQPILETYANIQVYGEIIGAAPQVFGNLSTAADRITNANGRTTATDHHPFFPGNANFAQVWIDDILTAVSNISGLLDCINFKARGICFQIDFPDIDFDLIRSYRLPTEVIELVREKAVTALVPKVVAWDLMTKPFLDYTDPDWVGEKTEERFDRTMEMVEEIVPDVDFPGSVGSIDTTNYEEIIDAVEGNSQLGEEARTLPVSKDEGWVALEHRILPNLFGRQVLRRLPFLNCHRRKRSFPYFSDSIIGAIFTRDLLMNWITFPIGMLLQELDPLKCSRRDMLPISGRTPLDILKGVITFSPSALLPGMQCGRRRGERANHGTAINLARSGHRGVDFTAASEYEGIRGLNFIATNLLFRGFFYRFLQEGGDPRGFSDLNDQLQWFAKEGMPHFEECYTPRTYWRNVSDEGNKDEEDDVANRAWKWTEFRCCDYSAVLVCWDSPCTPYRRQ